MRSIASDTNDISFTDMHFADFQNFLSTKLHHNIFEVDRNATLVCHWRLIQKTDLLVVNDALNVLIDQLALALNDDQLNVSFNYQLEDVLHYQIIKNDTENVIVNRKISNNES